jgi:cytidylate kinase
VIIAIDGTTASGKGTLARRLAAHYCLPHLDTGLLYRMTGRRARELGLDLADPGACAIAARDIGAVDATDPTLRSAMAGADASRVAVHQPVRAALLLLQREFATQPGGAILDGRDIGTVIAPNADVKFWVDADINERARRRRLELQAAGEAATQEEIVRRIAERDARDRDRADAPAVAATDAVRLDTTHLNVDAMLRAAVAIIDEKRAGKRA